MYDCSKEINKYYSEKVVLIKKDKDELWQSRRKNIKRLKKGLEAYNQENSTNYTIVEDLVQGSMAMHTVVQNDDNDYDIDVAVVFDEENLGDKGPQAARNMVANALKKETAMFSEEPEVKTGCIRIKYRSGYHVDFAVFKRYKEPFEEQYTYEHAGEDWTKRDIRAIEKWFSDKSQCNKLREVVRLSKMFTRSRESWKNMPSGLVQTVLCAEELASEYDRLDEVFYHTMKNISNRLAYKLEVEAPVDNGRPLVNRKSDYTRMENWRNRLEKELNKLDILFDNCSKKEALEAWGAFFNSSYWETMLDSPKAENRSFTNTEQFIEDLKPLDRKYEVKMKCIIEKDGFRPTPILDFLEKFSPMLRALPHNYSIRCSIQSTTCPGDYKVLWKVRNVGKLAEQKNMIRGQIVDRGKEIKETSSFKGPHFIECYIIKNGVCVAIDRTEVPIGGDK